MFQIGGDLHVLAAIDRADVLHARYFLGKVPAAGALEAAGHRGLEEGSHVFVVPAPLVLFKAGVAASIGKRLFVKVALAPLLAVGASNGGIVEQDSTHP